MTITKDSQEKVSRRTLLKSGAAIATVSLAVGVAFHSRRAVAADLRIRKNVTEMMATDPFFTDYADAIKAMHELQSNSPSDQRNWRNQALIHLKFCPHGFSDFLAWHRHYISYFEQICGALIGKPNFALPYWDWTSKLGKLPAPFFDGNPLNVTHWSDPSDAKDVNLPSGRTVSVATSGLRGITATRGLLEDPIRGGSFTTSSIRSIQKLDNFSNFQSRLEGSPHNNAHVITGAQNGHMSNYMSPLDPCFWLHHCNVDRIWAEWQKAGNITLGQSQLYNEQFVDEFGVAQNVGAASTADFESMGFTYDTLVDEQNIATANKLNVVTSDFQSIFENQQIENAVVSLGAVANTEISFPQAVTSIKVNTKDLIPNLFASRKFRPATLFGTKRIAVEQRRILARLKNIKVKGDVRKLLVNVFVNCPSYLSPETPYMDEYYADSFSFFGIPGSDGIYHSSGFLVDITDPLRRQAGDGRIATDEVRVQLVPIPVANGVFIDGVEFTVGSVEVFSV